MKRIKYLTTTVFLCATAFVTSALASEVTPGGDFDLVLKRAPAKIAQKADKRWLAHRAIAAQTEPVADTRLQFANVPRAYVSGSTLEACETRYKSFQKKLFQARALVLQASACQRVSAPVQGAGESSLLYQGILDFVR